MPETFLSYFGDLSRSALDFYSCFLSYAEPDDSFGQKLYRDMCAAGIRCWRWKEDAKWGDTLMKSIDEAIMVYDKLVVVCSEESLRSPAVIREIERALQKEDDRARRGLDANVLFPIRLDDYIFDEWSHHRKPDVIAKVVGDFCGWRDAESYSSSLDRLTRDLKSDSAD